MQFSRDNIKPGTVVICGDSTHPMKARMVIKLGLSGEGVYAIGKDDNGDEWYTWNEITAIVPDEDERPKVGQRVAFLKNYIGTVKCLHETRYCLDRDDGEKGIGCNGAWRCWYGHGDTKLIDEWHPLTRANIEKYLAVGDEIEWMNKRYGTSGTHKITSIDGDVLGIHIGGVISGDGGTTQFRLIRKGKQEEAKGEETVKSLLGEFMRTSQNAPPLTMETIEKILGLAKSEQAEELPDKN